jgi:hypothetical protein
MHIEDKKEYYVTPNKPATGDIWIDNKEGYSGIIRHVQCNYSMNGNVESYNVSMLFDKNSKIYTFKYDKLQEIFFFGGKNKSDAKSAAIYHRIEKIKMATNK